MAKKFTQKHEWVEVKQDKIAHLGISNFAQDQLGDIVFVDMPDVGANINVGDEIASIESVKAASEIYTPVSGEVIKINDLLENEPDLVNREAEGEGWLVSIKIDDVSQLESLMDEEAYKKFLSEQE